jgi:hypothetical protein
VWGISGDCVPARFSPSRSLDKPDFRREIECASTHRAVFHRDAAAAQTSSERALPAEAEEFRQESESFASAPDVPRVWGASVAVRQPNRGPDLACQFGRTTAKPPRSGEWRASLPSALTWTWYRQARIILLLKGRRLSRPAHGTQRQTHLKERV